MKTLETDSEREGKAETGIFIRAFSTKLGKFDSVDLYDLTPESLLEWLKRDGGDNKMAENVVGILLGHGHLHGVKS